MFYWYRRIKEEGLSLRQTFLIMLIVSLAVTAVLLYTAAHSFHSFHKLSESTDAYIDLQDTASSLLSASDYLTEEAQCYTVLGDRIHMDNYFHEAQDVRRRENAVESMKQRLPESDALTELQKALSDSINLMNREYYAMLLVLTAQGDPNIPEPIQDLSLTEKDKALSDEEMLALARTMMHDREYYVQKNEIREDLQHCVDSLKIGTRTTQKGMDQKMKTDLVWLMLFIILQSLGLILMLWITTSLGINPLITAVDHIKKDQSLPIVGAHEFRYLAGTYNKMYSAYKKSIDNLSYKASHDELTGVYNRAGYDLIKDSVDMNSTAFLLFDADKFKTINDTCGHEIGDKVLRRIAAVLVDNFRADDYVCRIGGDEFLVLMVHVKKDVTHLIEQKVKQINEDLSVTVDGVPAVSLSTGVSMSEEGANSSQMFRRSDIALYYVKEHGRNGCCFFTPDMEATSYAQQTS